ncbi:hypothetical protein [Gordonia sp. 852002-51296_SCH5728562-b]|uniref:hypothetical protein n=1 Tax=Gordonia sp. 852002-51296_SCH5728562-b TaxID=1834101 RepID=UPI000AC3B06C|nr:hypothetical protein [Gordonia sp. 852002-51296_SCH5728562-b]
MADRLLDVDDEAVDDEAVDEIESRRVYLVVAAKTSHYDCFSSDRATGDTPRLQPCK